MMRDLQEGEVNYTKGEYEEALEIARSQEEGGWKPLGLEGRCLLRLKRYDEAITALEKACEHDPPLDVWLNLSSALSAVKRYEEAYAGLEEAGNIHNQEYRLLMTKAKVLKKWGRKNLALSICHDTTSRYPLRIEAWEMLLSLAEATGDENSRHRAARSILELEGKHARALKAAAECCLSTKDLAGAKAAAGEYASIEPDKAVGWLLLSEISHGMGDNVKALAYVDRALQLNPRYTRAWVRRTLLMAEKEDDKEVQRSFDTAWKLNPSITKKMCAENTLISHLLESKA